MLRRALPKPKEITLHMSAAAFIRVAWPSHLPWWHCPNGEERGDRRPYQKKDGTWATYSPTGKKLKNMGVRPGVADFQFILPNGQAAFIEMKRPGEDLTEDQIKFRDEVTACGCGYQVCYSVAEVAKTLERWLALYGLHLRARLQQGALFGADR